MTTATPEGRRCGRRSPVKQSLPEPGEPGSYDLVVTSLQDLFEVYTVDTIDVRYCVEFLGMPPDRRVRESLRRGRHEQR
jgi:hypothetical protein